MRIQNLYADETGETHFREIEIELVETGPEGLRIYDLGFASQDQENS